MLQTCEGPSISHFGLRFVPPSLRLILHEGYLLLYQVLSLRTEPGNRNGKMSDEDARRISLPERLMDGYRVWPFTISSKAVRMLSAVRFEAERGRR